MSKTINFVVDHLDPLGQGVCKRIEQNKNSIITFVPKTLPGEQGKATVIKSSKGVEFAELTSLDKTSTKRIKPACEHYSECSGCDYLHVSYDDELAYKKASLLFMLRSFNLNESDIELITAPQRFNYRNRVQLHYRHKYIGFVDANSDRIIEVPNCLLLRAELKAEFDQLYTDKGWVNKQKGSEGKNKDGHCEIALHNGRVDVKWNEPYAHSGFTQVNDVMNEKLRTWLTGYYTNKKFTSVIDLFSGDGNLSDAILHAPEIKRVMVDNTPHEHPDFIKQDLFSEDTLDRFVHRSKMKKVDLLLLDPPRKGFIDISEWDKRLKPKHIVYVSCNPATLMRDLKLLMAENKKLAIKRVLLLDMFPSTRHFETVVTLES